MPKERSVMKKAIVITALTRMQGGKVCIAGYDYSNKVYIRPVVPYQGIDESYLFIDERLVIKPFAIVEFELLEHTPNPPHSEDWEIDTSVNPKLIRNITDRQGFLEFIKDDSVSGIFGAPTVEQQYLREGEGNRSLGTVKAGSIAYVEYFEKEVGRYEYRIIFEDEARDIYDLPVTDMAFRAYCDYSRANQDLDYIGIKLQEMLCNREVYINLGLARAFAPVEDEPPKYYILVTGVYSFPDYLEGRDYTDFK